MPKYLVTWEMDSNRAPVDPKERGVAWGGLTNMVKQDIKDGKITDWGMYDGGTRGYSISTMTDLELTKNLQQYYPYATFKVHQVLSIEQAADVVKFLKA